MDRSMVPAREKPGWLGLPWDPEEPGVRVPGRAVCRPFGPRRLPAHSDPVPEARPDPVIRVSRAGRSRQARTWILSVEPVRLLCPGMWPVLVSRPTRSAWELRAPE